MPRYFAQIEGTIVQRVIVCLELAWIASRLGGTWIETADPYSDTPQDRAYCGPGWGYDAEFPQRFAPQWVQPLGADVDDAPPYAAGSVVYHDGNLWTSTMDVNVWEPGVTGWRRVPGEDGLPPPWIQPLGAHDAYKIGEHVMHLGQRWKCVQGDAAGNNVWAPGVFGWEVVS